MSLANFKIFCRSWGHSSNPPLSPLWNGWPLISFNFPKNFQPIEGSLSHVFEVKMRMRCGLYWRHSPRESH